MKRRPRKDSRFLPLLLGSEKPNDFEGYDL